MSRMNQREETMLMIRESSDKFIGGQVLCTAPNRGAVHLFCGQLAKVDVAGDELHIHFVWFARRVERGAKKVWVVDDGHGQGLKPKIIKSQDISDVLMNASSLLIRSSRTEETLTLYLPDGSMLVEPAEVEGLRTMLYQ